MTNCPRKRKSGQNTQRSYGSPLLFSKPFSSQYKIQNKKRNVDIHKHALRNCSHWHTPLLPCFAERGLCVTRCLCSPLRHVSTYLYEMWSTAPWPWVNCFPTPSFWCSCLGYRITERCWLLWEEISAVFMRVCLAVVCLLYLSSVSYCDGGMLNRSLVEWTYIVVHDKCCPDQWWMLYGYRTYYKQLTCWIQRRHLCISVLQWSSA